MTGSEARVTAGGLPEIFDVTTENGRFESRMAFPGVAEHIRTVREFVEAALGEYHPCVELAVQLVSELATNSVSHSMSAGPDGTVWVAVSWTLDDVRVEVTDAGGETVPEVQDRGADADGGRGLRLVQSLSSDWGHKAAEAGHMTWFELKAAS